MNYKKEKKIKIPSQNVKPDPRGAGSYRAGNSPLPTGDKGQLGADVRFSYDSNGLLDIDITVLGTQQQYNKVILSGDKGLSESDIQDTLTRLNKFKQHPREDEVHIHIIATADKLYTFATGELRENILNNIKWFEKELETQDRKKIQISYSEFSRYLANVQEEELMKFSN